MQTVDIGIIGAGPGGLACAIRAQEHGLSFFIIEKGSCIFQGIIDSYPKGKRSMPLFPEAKPGRLPSKCWRRLPASQRLKRVYRCH